MGLEQGNETGGEVQPTNGGQTPSTGVAPSQTPQSASTTPAPWKTRIGDTEYDEATWKSKGVEDYRRLHGEYTRSRQEFSRLRDESGAGLELLEMVKGDPQLMAEVQRRLSKGQSPEQAVQGAVKSDPRIDSLVSEVDTMKQEKASQAFRAKHPDLTQEDEAAIVDWLGRYSEKLKTAGWSYDEILENAYNARFREIAAAKEAAALTKGQEMKEQEIQKGRKSQLFGAPSPTARTNEKVKKPTIHMSPAEREKHALERFKANSKKG